ncbi:hypothetical protein B0G62_12084 [Paraburkholderia eburnea]|uniref:Uncharacterized protein n=1 Tax=Paraburkholderia eburnea TaxID=1189126 RepID=A0A2S4LXA6_9BURK|nr:hypothetical protein [Paraburkholderia eburnea]POR47091.1 hypothetical protein B0G62_12084 [Paraburkholderia eburnea]PRZ18321.1 hypothetical protein BX588_12084 [Paraburkholderia eburnea]
MHETNQISPERMTPEQRRLEVASLLANGLVRLRISHFPQSTKRLPESEFELALSGRQRVHIDPVNNKTTESR